MGKLGVRSEARRNGSETCVAPSPIEIPACGRAIDLAPQPDSRASLPSAPGGTAMGLGARRAVAALQNRGVDPGPILAQCRLEVGAIEDRGARVCASAEARLIERAAEAVGDPTFGLHLAARGGADDAGLVSLVLATTPCVRETLRLFPHFGRIINESVSLSVAFSAKGAVVELRYLGILRRGLKHAAEFQTAALVQALRDFTGNDLSPVHVSFAHLRTDDTKPFERFFRCPVAFGADVDRVVLSSETLEIPNRRADPYLLQTLRPFAEEEIAARYVPELSFREAVDNQIFHTLARGEPTIEAISQSLAVSARTLSRRLADEGTTFPEVLTTLRRSLAAQYIQEPGLSIDQIGLLLGYSAVASFSHAFRRWTGVSPSAARRVQAIPPVFAEHAAEAAALN